MVFQKTLAKIGKYAIDRCDRLPVAIPGPKLNFDGVSTFGKIFTIIVSKENQLCRCCNNDVLISYCIGGLSFGDKIFGVGSKYLSLEGLMV
jgi:hypothetical protein